MWSRWNLSVDWKRTPPCGGHRYGSVLTTLTHSTSSQSQMAASTRSVLISGKTAKTAGPQPDKNEIVKCVFSVVPSSCHSKAFRKQLPCWASRTQGLTESVLRGKA